MYFDKLFRYLIKVESNEIPEFFALNILVLKLGGLWIPHKNTGQLAKVLQFIYNGFWLFGSCFLFVLFEFGSLPVTYHHYDDFIKNISILSTHIVTNIKIIFWFKNRLILFDLLNKLNEKTHLYEDYKGIQRIDGKRNDNDEETEDFVPRDLMAEQQTLANTALKLFLCTALGVSIIAGISCTFVLLYDYEDNYYFITDVHNVTHQRYDQILPYYTLIPFDHRFGRLPFFWAIWYQAAMVMNYAFIIVGFDNLFTSILSFICGHLMIVQGAFKSIRARCLRRLGLKDDPLIILDCKEMQVEMMAEFLKCVKHLQRIILTCEVMEKMYNMVTFLQMFLTMSVFCTNLYLVSSSELSNMGSEIIYMVAILNQVMLYCYFGHRVTISAESIPMAVYQGDWYSTNLSFKKNMVFTMTRMIKPIHFTIGKFSPLTLSTFVQICRASYSFFAVLKNGDGKVQQF